LESSFRSIADGSTIQAAIMRALRAGTKLKNRLRLVEEARQEARVPIILLS